MPLWYGYVGRWEGEGDARRWISSADADGVDSSKPAVGQWFFFTGNNGKREQWLYVKVFETRTEAIAEYNNQKAKGFSVLIWDSQGRSWESPDRAQGISAQGHGCSGCKNASACGR